MSEELPPFDESELSEEDRAVLRAFEEMEDWPVQSSASTRPLPIYTPGQEEDDDDMLMVFLAEVLEDTDAMEGLLDTLSQEDEPLLPARFAQFRRIGHKIRGTAGAMEHPAMATVGEHIELLSEQILEGTLAPQDGLRIFIQAVAILKAMLDEIVTTGQTNPTQLEAFEAFLLTEENGPATEETIAVQENPVQEVPPAFEKHLSIGPLVAPLAIDSFVSVDAQRVKELVEHSEQLAELRTSLESAQLQVKQSLEELYSAQGRLIQLEPALFSTLTSLKPTQLIDKLPGSSLIARILRQTVQRSDARNARKSRSRLRALKPDDAAWDVLNIENYTEEDLLLSSLREAIVNLNTASSRVRVAFTNYNLITHEYMTRASLVQNDALLLRLAPFSALTPQLREAFRPAGAVQDLHFEIVDNKVEVDQQILEALAAPLLQLLRTCSNNLASTEHKQSCQVWLYANEIASEIAIELGFSLMLPGSGLETTYEQIQRLGGSITLQRNEAGGISFHFRLPRTRGMIRCLLVRAGQQRLVVPFSQIQRIDDGNKEQFDLLHKLNDLLEVNEGIPLEERIQPVLVLRQNAPFMPVGILVDEVIDEAEFVIKPLPTYLHRPGITTAVIDGQGTVLLVLDLAELVRHYTRQHARTPQATLEKEREAQAAQPVVLLADDSVLIRQSLRQILERSHYTVIEAHDGVEALDQLKHGIPDIFLLDVEMPRLTGYDLLSMMRFHPALSSVKTIMLTSRTSEKHMQQALELGALAYLTKPCSHEQLLETIRKVLNR